jgi:hypothetical protein
MAPRTKKTVEFTTETFAKHITDVTKLAMCKNNVSGNELLDKMKKADIKSMTELGELVIQQWQLALFEMPKEVSLVRDYLSDNDAPRELCAQLNSVVLSI